MDFSKMDVDKNKMNMNGGNKDGICESYVRGK